MSERVEQDVLLQKEWLTSDFDFDLPPERIAQTPVHPRDQARLLRVTEDTLTDHRIADLPDLLIPGDLLVVNDTKVIPARLYGKRGALRVEILLHKKRGDDTWLAFARPLKRLHEGDIIAFAPDLTAELLHKREGGEVHIRFVQGANDIDRLLHLYGEPPLPPYIRRQPGEAKADLGDYQTIYAKTEGAVAAPTAGLHFTPGLLARLKAKDIETAALTLHVGAGTFQPVKAERIADHRMHAEWGEISEDTASTINQAKRDKRRIVAVGTTSLRLMETASTVRGPIRPWKGDTDIFLTPGHQFRTADLLLTNFHLPKSTLFMLVSAFAGAPLMKAAYAHAIAENYRFYSYGDACLLDLARSAQPD